MDTLTQSDITALIARWRESASDLVKKGDGPGNLPEEAHGLQCHAHGLREAASELEALLSMRAGA